jgi:hypothetical protein
MTATIIVYGSNSVCSACRRDCFPEEKSHTTLAGYGGNGQPGCGELFTAISAGTYYGRFTEENVQSMRPDLPWMNSWDIKH